MPALRTVLLAALKTETRDRNGASRGNDSRHPAKDIASKTSQEA